MYPIVNINEKYEAILSSLKLNQRPLVKLNSREIEDICSQWESSLNQNDNAKLIKTLCILENTYTTSKKFFSLYIKTFKTHQNTKQILIPLLSSSWKQVIDSHYKNGERLPFNFVQTIAHLLKHKDPEVIEWTLRTIDQFSSESISIKKNIIQAKPSFFSICNKHNRASRQIIAMLIKRWS